MIIYFCLQVAYSTCFKINFYHCVRNFNYVIVKRLNVRRSAVAASLNSDLARVQEWCNHWCMILNPNKTKAVVVRRSRTVIPPHDDLVFSTVSIRASPNLDILGVMFDIKLTFEDHVRVIVSRVNQSIGILRLVKRICVDNSVLLCNFVFVLPIVQYFSRVWGSAAECHVQLLERQVYAVARLCLDQSFLPLCHRRRVAGLSMLYKVNLKSNHCSASFHLLLLEFDIPSCGRSSSIGV